MVDAHESSELAPALRTGTRLVTADATRASSLERHSIPTRQAW